MSSLACFTRLRGAGPAVERYRLATDQIRHAERFGIGRAWVAQHHFRAAEGGLPAPFVFLAHVAAATSEIRLGTGVITLPLEDPVRVAEDAVVADLLSGGRIDLGLGSGGTPSSFVPFGQDVAAKAAVYEHKLGVLIDATVVRALLVPALMRLLGEANWGAPAPLSRVQERFGIREG